MIKILKYLVPLIAIGITLLVMLFIHYIASLFCNPIGRGADYITAILLIPVGATTMRLVMVMLANYINKTQNTNTNDDIKPKPNG